jgi:hypothetical protein
MLLFPLLRCLQVYHPDIYACAIVIGNTSSQYGWLFRFEPIIMLYDAVL